MRKIMLRMHLTYVHTYAYVRTYTQKRRPGRKHKLNPYIRTYVHTNWEAWQEAQAQPIRTYVRTYKHPVAAGVKPPRVPEFKPPLDAKARRLTGKSKWRGWCAIPSSTPWAPPAAEQKGPAAAAALQVVEGRAQAQRRARAQRRVAESRPARTRSAAPLDFAGGEPPVGTSLGWVATTPAIRSRGRAPTNRRQLAARWSWGQVAT